MMRRKTMYWVKHKTRTINLYCKVKNKVSSTPSRHAESEGTYRSTYSRHLIQA